MKNKHGGKRKGAGRPKKKKSDKKEQTKVMRVPLSKVAAVLATIGKAGQSGSDGCKRTALCDANPTFGYCSHCGGRF